MIPGEILPAAGDIELNAGLAAHHADRRQHRRPADPGRQPLPLRRNQSGAVVRPRRRARQAAGHRRRHRGALRARPDARSHPGPVSRQPHRARLPRRRHGSARLMARIPRAAYADMFGPTTGDRVRLADTDLIVEVERDLTTYGEEVKFGGGKVIRDGMGQSQASQAEGAVDTVITNALIIDHWGIVKADVAITNGRIAKIGKAGNPDIQPGRRHHHRPGHRDHRRRGQDPHRRRHRRAYPLHLSAAGGGRDRLRHHHADRRRHRSRHRHRRHHLHARTVASRAHAAGGRRAAGQSRLRRQGQCVASGRAGGDDPRRRRVPEAARGLGHHAGRDRLLPVGGRPVRRAGDDPHRHAERVRLRRGHHRRVQGPHHPRLPHRRRRRRARARHHQGRRRWPTCCRARPTRRGPTRRTRWTSISTC